MKKQLQLLTLAALGLTLSAGAQTAKMKMLDKASRTGNTKKVTTVKRVYTGNEQVVGHGTPTATNKSAAFLPETTIANTTYDLQSNSSVANRFLRDENGKMVYVFTYSQELSPYSDRGTGYVSNLDGTWSGQPDGKIETSRTGWPNVTWNANGAETVLSHNTVAEELELCSRPTIGYGSWTESTTTLPSPIATGNWWPRMVSGGADNNSLHALSITYPVASGGTLHNGLDGALLYSRSTDGGATWDKVNVQIPGMDTTKFKGFGGDSYAMDAKGNTIVIVTGDLMDDVVLWKSTDNGDTWTSQVIYDMMLPEPYDFGPAISDTNADGIADTLIGTGGSLAVLLDNNDKVHLFFDIQRIFDDTVSDQGYFTSFPYANPGLAYWTENYPDSLRIIGDILDLNGSGAIEFFADADGNGADEFGRYGNTGLVSQPSISVDGNNTVIVSYSAFIERGFNDYLKAYRHTYLKKSTDGGLTWSDPTDIYNDTLSECVFGILAHNSDSEAHLVYMRDGAPGHGVPPTNGGDPDPDNGYGDFIYVALRVSEIGLPIGIDEKTSNFNQFVVYPNPSNGLVNLQLSNKVSGKLNVEVLNVLGQTVFTYSSENPSTSHYTQMDMSNLSAGFYVVKAEMNGEQISKKLQIK
ncbi:MAG: T9SS type A sorting domain-containing protein [Bacteroidia bacterium]|nr:T9SS type A sorting domain-containing protein [Bacteroidia bacterium]